ncbi:MAG: ribosome maturation factor RimM [Lachnospiraceae bacterium]|nr:ribosome maturation factor RimM [Lachnospiraceae bacterium]
MQPELDYVCVGVLTKPHGVRGAVKVFPMTDDVRRFKKGQEFLLKGKKQTLQVKVETVQFFKQMVILKFEGIDTPEEIETYREAELLVDKAHRVGLKKGEYFISDIIGLSVVSDEGVTIGVVTDVLTTGANEVLVIRAEDGRELLFPSIKECILAIDPEAGKVTAHIMPGLMD